MPHKKPTKVPPKCAAKSNVDQRNMQPPILYAVNNARAVDAPPGIGIINKATFADGKIAVKAANIAEMAPDAPKEHPYDFVTKLNITDAREDAHPEIRYKDENSEIPIILTMEMAKL